MAIRTDEISGSTVDPICGEAPAMMRLGEPVRFREVTETELTTWDEMASRFVGCRIYHKRPWLRSLQASTGATPVYLLAEKGPHLVGCFPGLIARYGPLKIFGSPREGWQTESMGPLLDKNLVTTSEFMSAAISYLESQRGVHHIEACAVGLGVPEMDQLGFRGQQLFTYKVPLIAGDETAMKTFDGKTRNHLRKSIKLGLEARINEEELFIPEFLDQVKGVFSKRGIAMPFTDRRVHDLFDSLRETNKLLSIAVWLPAEQKCIATGIYTIDERELNLWGWAHRKEYGGYYPIEFLTWTAIQRGLAEGCQSLDLGGGGKAKVKFGAEANTNTYRWMRSKYSWLLQFRDWAKSGYRWQQSLRGRLRKSVTPVSQEQPASAQ